jgi:hypothetical protein
MNVTEKFVSELWQVTSRRYKEVAENGTEFSRQDRKLLRGKGFM